MKKRQKTGTEDVTVLDQAEGGLDITVAVSYILLCTDFLSYPLGCSMQSDPVFGSNTGDISIFWKGKHEIVR